jgi:hypothetical protein
MRDESNNTYDHLEHIMKPARKAKTTISLAKFLNAGPDRQR